MAQQLDSDGTGSPLATAVRHWKLLVAATLVGGVAGGAVGAVMPGEYTAETRLAVAAGSDNAYAIAGFPVAARDLASNYARFVTNGASDGSWSQPGVSKITATPIPESGVIRVSATSRDEKAAMQGAEAVAKKLLSTVDAAMSTQKPQAALQEYRKLAPQVSKAWAQVSVAESTFGKKPNAENAQALAQARAVLAEAQLIQNAQGDKYRQRVAEPSPVSQLQVIAAPSSLGTNSSSKVAFGAAAGAGVGLIVAFGVVAVRDLRGVRSRRSGRHEGDGLGSTGEGDVQVDGR
ncbi:Capsular polysaccharide biosynthesis protein [Dermatophilus congolensis]|uniref:Capsular polysaccharide biosynthesis protein n=1 Tax=Dermatophilus congolensis TaxID=1863 RepID=A0AA46BLP9_9MICO|nr:hypothetical protein [Dermatophilus congolensis]STD04889.1 Capsular polysaccharide biosynthesis protein [Dermatophilus congolensis]